MLFSTFIAEDDDEDEDGDFKNQFLQKMLRMMPFHLSVPSFLYSGFCITLALFFF